MECVGWLIIGIGVTVIVWLTYTLILFPNGRKNQRQTLAVAPVKVAPPPKLVNTEAMDRLWFFDPKTKASVDRARNELPLLYSKMQVLQQKIVGAKVDSNREEGTLMQNNVDGVLGLIVTGVAAAGLSKSKGKEQSLQSQVDALQKKIDEDEALIARYDDLSVKFARG